MKKSIIKFFDKIIVLLLGIVGVFTACVATKYGMPEADFEIRGVVTDKATAKPIQNIRIINLGDTLYTNSEGKYILKFRDGLWYSEISETVYHLNVDDIDGEKNGGEFESQEIDVKFTDTDQVKKGRGKKTAAKYAKMQNIELERKK